MIRNDEMRLLNEISWYRIKWILLAGGPIFFFIRAIQLAIMGNGCLGDLGLIFSWVLIFLEIALSGFAGIGGLFLCINGPYGYQNSTLQYVFSNKTVVRVIISTYILHLIRVVIWLSMCIF